jgi:hypothetical protein
VPRVLHAGRLRMTLRAAPIYLPARPVLQAYTKHDSNKMTALKEALAFQTQPLLSDLYYHKDLLDFSVAGKLLNSANG